MSAKMKSTSFILHSSFFISLLILASCSDWDDHYEGGNGGSGSDMTLWEQMQSTPELSDFCKVLENTKVIRMHHKTSVSYADMLNEGQSFTVVAPVNGSFNCDSLIELTGSLSGDSLVGKFFVLNHISRSNTSINANNPEMYMLNQKYKDISTASNTIEGVGIQQGNIHTRNGILHITQKPLPYRLNLFEALCDLPEVSAVGDVFKQFNEDYFNADASASSGIVEGVPVYVDSIIVERNRLLERIDAIDSEDSTFWVVAPTSEEWLRIWNEANQYFTYDNKVLKRDSLQRIWAARSLMQDAVFNMNEQKAPNDSLVSVPYNNWRKSYLNGRPKFHVFQKPFAEGGILANATAISCTNGMLYEVAKWPFTIQQTYFTELWSEAENASLIAASSNIKYNTQKLVSPNVSQNAYLQIIPYNEQKPSSSSSTNWELTYRVNNTLAGAYDICVVVLPRSIAGYENAKPCKFKAYIGYVDEDGNQQTFNCNNTEFKSDPEKIDTIVVAENFKFPTCNYDQNDIKATVKLACSISARQTSSYSREMYLDCIYLRPRTQNTDE
jgi:hypothetical protein